MDMPQFSKEEINGLLRTFNMYVKFPKSRWPDIKRAESNTPAGNKIYHELKDEFVARFWNQESQNFEEAAQEKTTGPR